MCSRIKWRCFSKLVNEGIPGREAPWDIACNGVNSFVTAFCFAISSSEARTGEVDIGAIVGLIKSKCHRMTENEFRVDYRLMRGNELSNI